MNKNSYRPGTDTGSLINLVLSGSKDKTPEVGMGATILCWTDRHAATIVSVTPKRIGITQDKATRTDKNGMSDSQTYSYETVEGAPVEYYTLRKNGAWVRDGEPMKGGQRVGIGYRDEHYDFSF